MTSRNHDNNDDSYGIVDLQDVRLSLESRAGKVEILRGIDLTIDAGQSVAIVGPSGSGKTSLLMIMAGLERQSGGTVRVAGSLFGEMSEDELALARSRSIGIVFQSFHLVPTMSALENVALPLEFAGRADAFDMASSLLRDVGLSDRLDHFPAQLSGGEQQRVALARALAPAPKLIFADEPTGNLDQSTGEQVVDLLFGLQQKFSSTLILVTHETSLASRCGRIIEMRDGQITEDKPKMVAA